MSLLGRYEKQPIEVEYYSIQFQEDMSPTDNIVSSSSSICRRGILWDGVVQTGPYTALVTDDKRIITTSFAVTLPAGAPDGFTLYVVNPSQSTVVTAGAFSVTPRGSIAITRIAGAWVKEAETRQIMVTSAGDQRTRNTVIGGFNGTSYTIESTVTTNEGRVLSDSFLVKIKDT